MATPFPNEGCSHLHHPAHRQPCQKPSSPDGESSVPGATGGDAPRMLCAIAPPLWFMHRVSATGGAGGSWESCAGRAESYHRLFGAFIHLSCLRDKTSSKRKSMFRAKHLGV